MFDQQDLIKLIALNLNLNHHITTKNRNLNRSEIINSKPQFQFPNGSSRTKSVSKKVRSTLDLRMNSEIRECENNSQMTNFSENDETPRYCGPIWDIILN